MIQSNPWCPRILKTTCKFVRPQPKHPSPLRKAIKNLSPTPITSPKYNPIGSPIWSPTQDKTPNLNLDIELDTGLRLKNELGITWDKIIKWLSVIWMISHIVCFIYFVSYKCAFILMFWCAYIFKTIFVTFLYLVCLYYISEFGLFINCSLLSYCNTFLGILYFS